MLVLREGMKKPKLKIPKKKKIRWTEKSMLHHIMTYIFLLFAAYSAVFLPSLYWASGYYHGKLGSGIEESIGIEAVS